MSQITLNQGGKILTYNETTLWADDTAMDTSKTDGVTYIEHNNKFYVESEFARYKRID